MAEIRVTLPGSAGIGVSAGTRVGEILERNGMLASGSPVVAALVNNEVTSLSFPVDVSACIEPVTSDSAHGIGVYRRSLCFLLAVAVADRFPDRKLVIGHSLGDSYYYHFDGMDGFDASDLASIDARMREIIAEARPIERMSLSYAEALEHFEREGQEASLLLLRYRNENKIAVHRCGPSMDLAFGPLIPNTRDLGVFELRPYPPGFLLRYPGSATPRSLSDFQDNPQLFSVYQEYKRWGKILNVHCVGNLNDLVERREIHEFIRVAEALHNKKIAEIADRIRDRRGTVKAVFIAGPSSSGKTTFSKKLAIQLRVTGFNPVAISLDDYFVSRDRTPKDENGEYDFEALEALDIELLNDNLVRLFAGETIELPIFDFKTGGRKPSGRTLTLSERSVVVLEGIHGLNERLTPLVRRSQKYTIYVSALTQLNLDDHNRISTTDNRLLRRMVRDNNFRGYSALTTLSRWPSVRRGEDRNIFPYQNNADSAFNSALDYELAVLKTYAEPLLMSVKPQDREYSEAIRLLSFLKNFAPLPATFVPDESILREFIGNSAFHY